MSLCDCGSYSRAAACGVAGTVGAQARLQPQDPTRECISLYLQHGCHRQPGSLVKELCSLCQLLAETLPGVCVIVSQAGQSCADASTQALLVLACAGSTTQHSAAQQQPSETLGCSALGQAHVDIWDFHVGRDLAGTAALSNKQKDTW